jgi:hypothetical protein
MMMDSDTIRWRKSGFLFYAATQEKVTGRRAPGEVDVELHSAVACTNQPRRQA